MSLFARIKKRISKRENKMSTEEKPVSVREFKAMIQGIDIMGGEKFTPNAEQWSRIRRMIDRLEDTPAPVAPPAPAVLPMAQPAAQPRTAVVNPHNPLENDSPEFIAPPPSGVPAGSVTQGASTSALAPPPAPAPAPTGGGTKDDPIKTPDIDTSGGYNSSFV